MSWYKHPKLQAVGLVILSLLAVQILQVILFLIISVASQNISSSQGWFLNFLAILPVLISLLAGGAFLGRLRPFNALALWSVSAVVNALIPVGIQVLLYPETLVTLGSLVQWTTIVGNILFWFVGCVLGSISQRKAPNSTFDRGLVQWTAGITGAIIFLYGLTWGSLVFSKGYRLAKAVELPLPEGVEEVQIRGFDPGIAQAKRFKTTIASSSTVLQEYFGSKMAQNDWTDITELFQSWPLMEWRFHSETVNNQAVDYAISGGHWQDLSGKVVATLVLQCEKVDVTKDWEETDWDVNGIILSRPYTEPPDDSVIPDDYQDDNPNNNDVFEKQVDSDSQQEIAE